MLEKKCKIWWVVFAWPRTLCLMPARALHSQAILPLHLASSAAPMMDRECCRPQSAGQTTNFTSSFLHYQDPATALCILYQAWPIHARQAASSAPDVTPGPTARSCPQSHDCFDGSLVIVWVNSYLRLNLPDLLRSIAILEHLSLEHWCSTFPGVQTQMTCSIACGGHQPWQ